MTVTADLALSEHALTEIGGTGWIAGLETLCRSCHYQKHRKGGGPNQ